MHAILKWLHSGQALLDAQPPSTGGIGELRRLSLDALSDCNCNGRLRQQLAHATTAQQIWQMRCEMYQAIALRHCESVAVRRLDALLPAFESWLPASALVPLGSGAHGCRQ